MVDLVSKTRRLLQIVFSVFLVIVFRVWHLGVVQREERLVEAQKPQQRQILLRANRGTICDRFGVPLAVNRICYNAMVYYGQIAQIPVVSWQAEEGGRKKIYPRKKHIQKLSQLLAETLGLEAERIEDLIHAKAALFPHVPYLIKAGLTEEEYYQLKMLEKDWLGLYAEIGAERSYPLGKTASHLIGTMGTISAPEYQLIAQEIHQLQEEIAFSPGAEEAERRLAELKEKAYTLNDLIGKNGVEGEFEERLRGFFGKTTYEVDQKGRFVRELGGAKLPLPGEKIELTISAELQAFAEQLLAASEKERFKKPPKQPWIRGGAIVALDPHTGEVLALASYPFFDPNDFIPSANPKIRREKNRQVNRWLETEEWIRAIWEGRETLSGPKYEKGHLTWDLFLELLLPVEGPLQLFFQKVSDIQTAVQIQEDFATLCYFSPSSDPFSVEYTQPAALLAKRRLGTFLADLPLSDKFYAIDLCRLVADATRFTDPLLSKIGSMKLSTYFSLAQVFHRWEAQEKQRMQEIFHQGEFRIWREREQKEFLARKRCEEKRRGIYAHPYIDYLDKQERELFEEFWRGKRLSLPVDAALQVVPPDLIESFLHTFRSFDELEEKEQKLASSFYPKGGLGFSRSYAFQTSAPQGSLFKLVTSYEGLRQGNRLSLIDEQGHDGKGLVVAYSETRAPYPRIYKGGRLPKSSISHIGLIDVVGALEQSSNPFFSILAGDYLKTPEDLVEAARLFGFGAKTGIALSGEAPGFLPRDLAENRTGVYSFAIGQHTLLATPLQSALFLAALANGGALLKPHIIASPAEVKSALYLPPFIRSELFEGMDRSLWSAKGSARPSTIKSLLAHPTLLHDYLSLQHQMIGKTSTAEVLWNPFRNPSSKPFLHKHIWFGAIAFDSIKRENPELVVVVMQRYGDSGKELAPLAAQMIRKWREIQRKKSSFEPIHKNPPP